MLRITEILSPPLTEAQLGAQRATPLVLTLPYEMRQKTRFKVRLDDGTEVGLFLSRGQILRSGDFLRAEDGQIIRVEAADEKVSTVRHEDMYEIARCAYHLGNRHVALQIGRGWLRYQTDHVLDDMMVGLGLEVISEMAPFEPEGGAYGGHSHGQVNSFHAHADGHSHSSHSHSYSSSHSYEGHHED